MNHAAKLNRYHHTRKALIFWTLFIGIGALFGSTCMFIDPTGAIMKMDTLLPYFQVLPFAKVLFQNYIFSGISLLIVNGLSNFLAAYFLFRKKYLGTVLGFTFGITLMLWICIQFVIFPTNFMDIIYFIFGLSQMLTGLAGIIFYHQAKFVPYDTQNYTPSKDSKTLVVYFSRMGYTESIAYDIAKSENCADIVKITTKEKTENTLGFWWCGRFGMHRWAMDINEDSLDLTKYTKVIVVSPTWVFGLASPIRGFLKTYEKELHQKEVEFGVVHFMNFAPKSLIKEIKKDYPKSNISSYISHVGKIKKETKNYSSSK